MSNYCFTCMNEIPEGNTCPHCHKENTPDAVLYRLKPGTVLNNKYLVGNCLGEGGFGITYIGRDLVLDIRIAIKEYYPNGYVNRNHTVNSEVSATTESQKHIFNKGKDSFLDEARKVAKFLGEPGIVGVRDFFETNGTAYIIMEYLEGENLAAYIKHHGTFEATKIFKLMLPVMNSLKRVHDSGMIHRDISPDNIMFMKNGRLKLMDFGSARYFTNEKKEMSVLLKQGYAPEEQYRKNGKQGPWTDVYSLSATIYRCITGSIPEDALDRLRNDDLIPPSEMGAAIPEALENILLYGLAVFRENRCQDMEEFSNLIENALANPQKAAAETAHLRPAKNFIDFIDASGSSRTVMANDRSGAARPLTINPQTNNPAPARPLTGNPQTARPLTGNPAPARPLTGNPNTARPVTVNPKTNQPVTESKNAKPAKVQKDEQKAEKPKKGKKGLIFGLIGGVVAIAAVAVILFLFVFGNKLDGTYHMTELIVNGQNLTASASGITSDMIVQDDVGTMSVGDSTWKMDFDPDASTVVLTIGSDTSSSSYRIDGKKLIIEDADSTRLTFEKQ